MDLTDKGEIIINYWDKVNIIDLLPMKVVANFNISVIIDFEPAKDGIMANAGTNGNSNWANPLLSFIVIDKQQTLIF